MSGKGRTVDTDDMPAGREMDALIAEHVFDAWGRQYLYTESDDPPERIVISDVPHYSTDIKDAWGIVEHLDEEDVILSLFDNLGYDVDEERNRMIIRLWRAEFMDAAAHSVDRPMDEIWFGVEEAPTAPLAICKAALRVVMK